MIYLQRLIKDCFINMKIKKLYINKTKKIFLYYQKIYFNRNILSKIYINVAINLL